MYYETLAKIGDCYRESFNDCEFARDLTSNFSKHLSTIRPSNQNESLQLNKFIHQLEICETERKQTLEITDLAEDIIFALEHIVLWYNSTHKKNVFLDLFFRRKAYQSEFKKSLRRTLMGKSAKIKDRFAFRYILRNRIDEIDCQELLYILTNLFIEMYCGSSKKKENFIHWCEKYFSRSPITISRIKEILSIPFELIEAEPCYDTGETNGIIIPKKSSILECYQYGVKDYVFTPKEKGYQALHFVLHINSSSPILPGVYFEFQGRTRIMNMRAENTNSTAFHFDYKKDESLVQVDNREESISLDDIIKIDDCSKIHITGYDWCEGFEDDAAGIRNPIFSYTRKILSPSTHN